MNSFFLVVAFCLIGLNISKAQVTGQPESVGLTLDNPSWAYGTLFEPTGRYYLTCAHWYPADNSVLTFGNGRKGTVKQTYLIRAGFRQNQYDIAVGELQTPVKAKVSKTWWTRPLDLVGDQIQITGFGLDGHFTGTNGYIVDQDPNESYKGLWYSSPAGTVRPGYSGSPIFFRGNLLGINWAAWGVEPGVYIGGIANTISMVFAEYYQNFPEPFQPPVEPQITIRKVGSQIEVVLLTPVGEWGITSSGNCESNWNSVETCSGFIKFEECPPNPWQKILRWNLQNNRQMFFRGEKKEEEPQMFMRASLFEPSVSNQNKFLVTPCR